MNALIWDISLKKFPSFSANDEPFFLTGVFVFSVVSINGCKGIIYQGINHAVKYKNLPMLFEYDVR